ncbi:type II toxin-antitoxin system RelE family toxin [Gallibacterium anatis]|uniref:Plasmid stabilization system protein n=3 Tax=Gallibacterium anatis TaxID=750 RepID=A0A0A2ZSY0_9PAST|nr:type II toxin-antitoxin system RelE/ParE family toxin [Gallibacterium anatis]AEC18182.1 Plasmid stabilization system protein [Gallibacterium anatis UMN179]KGQ27953.1 plasmid stabilization system protein [Gallibacterium anatis CCM5995]KGQ32629.1 plasmid stabilization system protein [Gallibacterium anatis]KGQ43074.1 plasmid stabilization system protein [Gallibacterium anatis]KGQ43951.1 plasmid stabilization system protein [Gallibacterium anatis]
MAYAIKVHSDFVAELNKLDSTIKNQLRKKLEKVVHNPHIPKNRLSGELHNCYKIKLRKAGVRLVYQVNDDEIYILLLTVGKREAKQVYNTALNRV